MKEIREQLRGQKERDNAIVNFASRQAQEAILDPNLPEAYKDEIVDEAVTRILKIAERKNAYDVKDKESGQLNESQTIYKSK